MKRETDELTELFRHRLNDMEMPVKSEFWLQLNNDMATAQLRRRLMLRRMATSAAVLLLLIASSATIWFLSPQEEVSQAFAPVAATDGDFFTHSEMAAPVMQALAQEENGQGTPASIKQNLGLPLFGNDVANADEDYAEIHISFTISMYESSFFSTSNYSTRFNKYSFWRSVLNSDLTSARFDDDAPALFSTDDIETIQSSPSKWSAKAAAGISLPDKEFNGTPFSVAASIERRFNRYFGLEAGLQYSRVPALSKALHYLGIPVKANGYFFNSKHVELYASVGGTVDKCVAGAPNNNFRNEPLQLSVQAGVGANFKISDKLAVFVEPGVNHYFPTDSKQSSVRTSRPTNFNVLCGMRFNY